MPMKDSRNESFPSSLVKPTEERELPSAPLPSLDGGPRAWLQCLTSFLIFFNTWGMVNAFGIFENEYRTSRFPRQSESNISWCGSLQAFLLLAGCLFTGPLFDRGYYLYLTIAGTFFSCFGLFMTSIATQFWQTILAQGLCMGIGFGLLFVQSISITPQFFLKKRAFVLGIGAAGSSVGGIVYPIVLYYLLPRIGFGWATRVMAFIMLGTLLITIACIRTRLPPKPGRRVWDLAALRSKTFVIFSTGSFFGFMGLYIPFFVAQIYAVDRAGFSPSSDLVLCTVVLLNAGSVLGRILPGFIADKIGPNWTLLICTTSATILAWCWIAVRSIAGLLVWDFLYGMFSGTLASQGPAMVARIVVAPNGPGLPALGTWIGMNLFASALGLLVGNPVAGVILRQTGSWIGVQVFCASALTCTVVCLIATTKMMHREGVTGK